MIQHVEYQRLHEAIARLAGKHTRSYQHVLYRFAKYRYSDTKDLLSGQGTLRWGSRYGAPETFPIVYGSTDYHLALDETCAEYKRYNISSPPLHHVVCAFECSLTVTLDLRTANVTRSLGVSQATLTGEDWRRERDAGRESLTQAIGRAAQANRLQALLVPSPYSSTGHNVVIFPDSLDRGAYIKLLTGE